MKRRSKLGELLDTFQAYDWNGLSQFVTSPAFNNRPELVRYVDYLQAAPEAQRDDVRLAWRKIYPGEPVDKKRWNYLNNWMLSLAEDYLLWKQLRDDVGTRNKLLMQAYLRQGLHKHFGFIARKEGRQLEEEGLRTLELHRRTFQWKHLLERERAQRHERRYSPELQEANDALDAMYLAHKLVYLCEMMDMERFVSGDYDLSLLETVKAQAAKGPWAEAPLVQVYGRLLEMLSSKEASPENLLDFVERMREHQVIFSDEEQRSLFFHAINYCIHGINQGVRDFAPLLMDLYREGLESGILMEGEQISPWTFKNMVKLGLGLKEYDWVEHFVTTYSDRLPANERSDALDFNMADLHYHKGEYDKAMEYLMEVTYSDIHYNLGAKVMLLKIYYEKGEEDSFDSLLHSFNVFLLRNKLISAEQRKPYRAFVRLLLKLARAEKEQLSALRKQIERAKALSDRSWLLQQVDLRAGNNKQGTSKSFGW